MTFFARCLEGFLRHQHLGKRLRRGGPVREPGVRVSVRLTVRSVWSLSVCWKALWLCWCTPNDGLVLTLFPYAMRRNMKHATTLKSPKTTSNRRVDPDNPPWSEEMLGPPVFKRGRGPQKAPTKVLTTVRLDADVLAFFKAQGSGYQTRINDGLRKIAARGPTPRSTRARAKAAGAG
jgi:uncharacterized protein (DUF4415 family)